MNQVRYAGVLAANSKWRARIVPPPPPVEEADDPDCAACTAKRDKPPTHRCGYRPWRELLRRSFKIDVEHCDHSGARMKLRALVITSAGIERTLKWLGEPTEPPQRAPSRGPPSSRAASSGDDSASPSRRSCSTRIERALENAEVCPVRRQPRECERALPIPGLTRLAPEPPDPLVPQSPSQAGKVTCRSDRRGVHADYALRAHGLIKKIPRTHRYQLTERGRFLTAALRATRDANIQQLRRETA